MGVKFGREYEEIIEDLTGAMCGLKNCNELFEMSTEEWMEMNDQERRDCITTLADDIFYGLGAEPMMSFGTCQIAYDRGNHLIKIAEEDKVIHIIRLI
ncbi:hypothetical protein [Paenibacillus sp. J2TS4]|uniref:hypothetical protein n=1 Tax=Paenibacillus sp. J2TS4 TaxID=2807194 RepID=UPI001B2AA8E4|nr:hypothetical protein [Paenibacillus sp. J2TS4]GIP34050.1 hypothetical protein J2TS4_32600 [Paenibacillus sp. J2TS4]